MNYNPCDKQAVNSMKRVVRLIYGENLQGRSSEDLIPSTWICPIKQVSKKASKSFSQAFNFTGPALLQRREEI